MTGRPGKVYLIGAGPGDPGLLTVRGAELLGSADVVLYDGLINEALLQFARKEAIAICVGKHGHGGIWTQSQIDDETVRYAHQGKTVVRLKGGDTAIFARTAEEAERLADEKIPFEIVPGITAALAASAYAGIPMTHRDWSSAVAIVTGQLQHSDATGEIEDALDWEALARFPGTLVMYMGVTTADHWSRKLIEFGKPTTTPVALLRRCTWPDQQVVRCELGTVGATLEQTQPFRPPVIAIIGEVTRENHAMDWFGTRPWFGKNVWITNPSHTGLSLAKLFSERGANAIQSPVIDISPPESWLSVDAHLRVLNRFDVIVFSSAHGVQAFFERLVGVGSDARSFGKAKIAAVGKATKASLAKYFVHCDIVPNQAGASELADVLEKDCLGKRFLFVRNPDGETIAMDRLLAMGAIVESMEVYRQNPIGLLSPTIAEKLRADRLDAVTATSKNIAKQTLTLLGPQAIRLTWLSLAPSISEYLKSAGCTKVLTASSPDFASLVELKL
jgi:uroporphyrinogen III methyltransferase / synthase